MRLFTGIAIPEEAAKELAKFTGKLKAYADLRWSRPEKLHLTTAFIGDWPEKRLRELREALHRVTTSGPIDLFLARAGWMPSVRFARALYAGAGPYEPLHDLHKATARVLTEVGVELEDRIYRPHVTLARRRGNTDIKKLNSHIEEMDTHRLTGFVATSFHLYLSADGAYTKLEEYPL